MEFTQHGGFSKELFEGCLKSHDIDLELDMDLIESDCRKLVNNKRASAWLRELPSYISGRLTWTSGKPVLKTEDGDVELINIRFSPMTRINLSRYIAIEPEKAYIYVDYSDIFNGIALELLGPDVVKDDVEEVFDSLSIDLVSVYDGSILKRIGWLNEDYELLMQTSYCDGSPYINLDRTDKKESYDYFYNTVKIGKTSASVINSSTSTMLKMIIMELLNNCGDDIMICDVNEKGLTIVVDSSDEETYKRAIRFIRQKVVFKIFSRRFGFSPTVTIIEGL